MRRPIITAVLAAAAAASGAQSPTGFAAVDSAAVARAAYRRAINSADAAVALQEIGRSAAAWPTQSAYLWARAIVAARAQDTATVLGALGEYASLSLGRDIAARQEFAFLASSDAFRDLARRHDANRAPLVASHVVRQIDDSTFWPEGMDYDPASRSFFLASVRRGTIMRIDASGRAATFWAGDSTRHAAALAVRVDTGRRSLWVTTSGIPQFGAFQAADSGVASLFQLRLDDGSLIRRWDFIVWPGGHVLGDIAIGPAGDLFITDSQHPVLYRLRASLDTLEATTHGLFASLQGSAPTPDGRSLYVADYILGILHIDLVTGAITRLADAPRTTSLGCDGLTWHQGSLICVQNGVMPARIMRFVLDATGKTITRADIIDRNSAIADEPTIGTIVGDEFVYVANTQWDKHDNNGKLLPNAGLRGPILLGVKVP